MLVGLHVLAERRAIQLRGRQVYLRVGFQRRPFLLGSAGCRRTHGGSPAAAFTLVELVVALAIASGIIAWLLPVFSSVRESARSTVCASNLHQLGVAFLAYAQDHDGYAPPYYTGERPPPLHTTEPWKRSENLVEALRPYVGDGRLWFCPSDPYAGLEVYASGHNHRFTSYHVQWSFRGTPPWLLPYPDARQAWGPGAPTPYPVASDANNLRYWGGQHLGGYRELRCDGSVKREPAP
jgi:prepilin-type N-terminal cleavage/methylation domain-containing protein